MALDKDQLVRFANELIKASRERGSRELIFESEWIWDLPTQGLEVAGKEIHYSYDIPIGWNGYGKDDLDKLESMGFLRKIDESEEDPVTLQKTIKYQITGSTSP